MDLPRLAGALVAVCSCATVAAMAWLVRLDRARAESPYRFDLGYGLAVASMLLVSPLGWMYYFPFLALPGYAVWALSRDTPLRGCTSVLWLAWVLSAVPTQMVKARDAADPSAWFALNSVYFYALVVLAVAVVRSLHWTVAPPATRTSGDR
jgi:hypothetical protein